MQLSADMHSRFALLSTRAWSGHGALKNFALVFASADKSKSERNITHLDQGGGRNRQDQWLSMSIVLL